MMKKFILLILFIISINSCSEDPNNVREKLIVQTHKSNYLNSETINFTIKNFNPSTGHLASCCTSVAFYIDKNENENWIEHSNFGLPCLALCPGIDLTISFTESLTDSTIINESGKFRIRVPYTFDNNQNWTDEIVSNSFIIQ
jgi:hypothetical protein